VSTIPLCGHKQLCPQRPSSSLTHLKYTRLEADAYEQVSILQLIITPERYDGKRVQVEGFLHLEFEGNVLYLSENDYIHHMDKNGLWVTRNSTINERFQQLNSHYVIVIGTFDAANKGHMSMNSGSLKNISAADTWPEFMKAKT
jgi:hypothetical protein